MLVLSRKLNEQIKIGDDITITVVKLRNNQIRIGIDAPREIRVLRGELAAETSSDPNTKKPLQPASPEQTTPSLQSIARSQKDESPTKNAGSTRPESLAGPQTPIRRNEVVDGLQCAADLMNEGSEDLTAPSRAISPAPTTSQPLRVFMGRVKMNASTNIVPADSADHFVTAI